MDTLKTIFFTQGFSVILPALTGLARWRNIQPADRPIIFICWLFVANELTRSLLVQSGYRGYDSYNIGALLAAWLYVWQFANWGIFGAKKSVGWAVGIVLTVVWLADHFLFNSLSGFTHIFRLCASGAVVAMSIVYLNKLIMVERDVLFRNGRFIITAALLVYYSYRILMDEFNRFYMSESFLISLGDANRFFIIGLYLFFTIGILCLPKKKDFFLP